MQLDTFDLVASLQALPETDPIEIDGIQFGDTCQAQCQVAVSVNVPTVCAVVATCI